MRCFRCKKPISKVWAQIAGHVYGPDCAQKLLGGTTSKRYKTSSVMWHSTDDTDDNMNLFEDSPPQ